jgi:hypothetical protein
MIFVKDVCKMKLSKNILKICPLLFVSLVVNAQQVEYSLPIDTTDTKTLRANPNTGNQHANTSASDASYANKLPYTDVKEKVVFSNGKNRVRIAEDKSLCFAEKMKNKSNCFIVISKKDYYLYVYEAQGKDTVLLARFDCAFGLRKGDKGKQGDMRTPHCVGLATPGNTNMRKPFTISQIVNSSSWRHDFGDGRGNILSYGKYFMRLQLNGHKVASNRSIGIHGSTNNAESVPGRASQGCIRLKDADIIQLKEKFCFVGMKVYIKAEAVDDLPFEIKALKALEKQGIKRKRHLDSKRVLTNEQIINTKTR